MQVGFGIQDLVTIFVCPFFCSPIYTLRNYPVARISSEKLKEILPNALVAVQDVDGTYIFHICDNCNTSIALYGKIEIT